MLGGVAPLRVVLGRTERVAVAALGATVYPQGLSFDLTVRMRPSDDEDDFVDPFGQHRFHRRRAGEQWPPPDVLRFGIGWPDGRKATMLDGRGWPYGAGGPQQPEGPLLSQRGGGGGGGSWSIGLWLWPLPPPGTIDFVCEWPSEGIPETRVPIETAPLLEAAARAEILWPEEGGGSSAGSSSFQFIRSTLAEENG